METENAADKKTWPSRCPTTVGEECASNTGVHVVL